MRTVLLALTLAALLAACRPTPTPPPGATHDTLRLLSNDGGDQAVALFDGRRGGACKNDTLLRLTSDANVASVESSGGCNDELMVFSDDDAAVFLQPTWHDFLGDDVQVDLSQDPYLAPLTIWIVSADPVTQANYAARAALDLARARQLYNTMNTGIGFDHDPATDTRIVSDPAQVTTIEDTISNVMSTNSCSTGPIRNDANIHVADRLNVYYANVVGLNGFACNDGEVIFMSPTANNETLSHEVGHALDMDHYGASNDNIMWSVGIAGRDNFTIGQAFRMNLNPGSALNLFAPRAAFTRNCAHATINANCPDITLDALPK